MRHPVIRNILAYYEDLVSDEDYSWMCWAENPIPFKKTKANQIFVSVLLDQGQKANRAWEGGNHLVENYFGHKKGFWHGVSMSSLEEVTQICQRGYDGKSYATRFTFNKFPTWLKTAADKMLNKYDGDPRKIWAVSPEQVDLIYERLKEFDGIGDALAKMGQFILVRNYGVAGGSANKHQMSIKPDELLRRVMYRTGLSPSSNAQDVIESAARLRLKSPADFDAASWVIGRNYCHKTSPKCKECPISKVCERVELS